MSSRAGLSSLWIGSALGPIEKLSLSSAVATGMEPTLWSYNPVEGVPDGVRLADASDILRPSEIFKNPDRDTFAGFSNLFRYVLLAKVNTIWFDLDMVFNKEPRPSGSHYFGRQDKITINGALLALPRNEPLISCLIGECRARISNGFRWGGLGPNLLTEELIAHGLTHLALPASEFYGVPFRSAWKFFHPDFREEVERAERNSIGLHLWNEVIRTGPFSALTEVPEGSFLSAKLRHFDIPYIAGSASREKLEIWRRNLNPPASRARSLALRALPQSTWHTVLRFRSPHSGS